MKIPKIFEEFEKSKLCVDKMQLNQSQKEYIVGEITDILKIN